MIEAVMFWNEPNNKSHWDFEVDPDWNMFAEMVKLASTAVRAENPQLTQVLGGISLIDPAFIRNRETKGVLNCLDVVACMVFRSTGIIGPFTSGPTSFRRFATSQTCRSGFRK